MTRTDAGFVVPPSRHQQSGSCTREAPAPRSTGNRGKFDVPNTPLRSDRVPYLPPHANHSHTGSPELRIAIHHLHGEGSERTEDDASRVRRDVPVDSLDEEGDVLDMTENCDINQGPQIVGECVPNRRPDPLCASMAIEASFGEPKPCLPRLAEPLQQCATCDPVKRPGWRRGT
jgi:hypothetical protein